MIIAGYIAAVFIGITLGLIGGGGSILTVPVLVFLFGVDAVLATSYSLFVVGLTASVGAAKAASKQRVDFKVAAIFALPAFATVFFARAVLLPAIPDSLFFIGGFDVTKRVAILVFFSLVMVAAAYSMIKKRKDMKDAAQPALPPKYSFVMLQGALVGIFTGLVGAGGGFLIIPALVLFAKLPMKKAVGTSLLIIAANSAIGFISDFGNYQTIDWPFLFIISSIAIAGIFIGMWLAKFIDGKKLKVGFGWFVLLMAVYILVKELVLN